jgi:hypothetical protein
VWAELGGATGFVVLIGSIEWRMRNKVSQKTFDATIKPMQKGQERIESHLYDLLKERHIIPTRDVPENIKNGSR